MRKWFWMKRLKNPEGHVKVLRASLGIAAFSKSILCLLRWFHLDGIYKHYSADFLNYVSTKVTTTTSMRLQTCGTIESTRMVSVDNMAFCCFNKGLSA